MANTQNKMRTYLIALGAVALAIIVCFVALIASSRIDISLAGDADMTLTNHESYEEPGASVQFSNSIFGNSRTLDDARVDCSGSVDSTVPGEYKLTYRTAYLFWTATAKRTVTVKDTTPPEIMLAETSGEPLELGAEYADPGFTASDDYDGDVTSEVTVSGEVDTATPGDYTITYTVTDAAGNTATATRTITVNSPPQPEPEQESAADVPDHKVVYLTFDDGPSQYTQQLLDVLAKHNVKATFFVTSYGDPSLIGKEAKAGHSIGVHTFSHDYNEIYASEAAFFEDYEKMQAIIEEQTGSRTTLMRFPGGSSNAVSDFNPGIMSRLVKEVANRGYQYFDWNVSSGDGGGTTDTDQVVTNVIEGIQGNDVSVVLQHDTKDFSVNAVDRIITWGLENGYTFLPLTPSSPTAHHGVNN